MPDKETIKRARADKRAGKSASTQAGEFVKREIEKIREGEHGAKNAKQAIAIGLSEARRAGVEIADKRSSAQRKSKSESAKPSRRSSSSKSRPSRKTSASKPRSTRKASGSRKSTRSTKSRSATKRSATSRTTRRSAARRPASTSKRRSARTTHQRRSQAVLKALKKMPRRSASHLALSRQAHAVARRRSAADRSAAARKAARTRSRERSARAR